MNKKKKLIIGSSAVAGLAVVGGAFALFSDNVEIKKSSTVGTVSIDSTSSMHHYQLKPDVKAKMEYDAIKNNSKFTVDDLNPDDFEDVTTSNLNPGDNNPGTIDKGQTPNGENENRIEPGIVDAGTDHEIVVNIENKGTKSVETRVLFEVTAKNTETPIDDDGLRGIKLYFDTHNTMSGLTAIPTNNYQLVASAPHSGIGTVLNEYDDKVANQITYLFDNDIANTHDDNYPFDDMIRSGMILSGTGANAEVEKFIKGTNPANCPVKGTFKVDMVMSPDLAEKLAGGNITIKVRVQAMQFRGTNHEDWQDISVEEIKLNSHRKGGSKE